MTLKTACTQKHTLVNIVNSYWVCECPQVYRLMGKFFMDPSLKGLLDDIIVFAGGLDAIKDMARSLERAEADKKAAARKTARQRKQT